MVVVVQRVRSAGVSVVAEPSERRIGHGIVVRVAFERDDDEACVGAMARRCVRLRVFEDAEGRLNRSLIDVGGSALLIPNFTLAASTVKGHRPSFERAASPSAARGLFERFVASVRALGVPCEAGFFGSRMEVEVEEEGPVTLVLVQRAGGRRVGL